MMSESDLSLQLDNNNITPSDSSNNNVENHKISNVPKDESSDISPPSSGASSKSTASKQSGIRPPSRIGRPCGGIQKPAIPTPPTKNSSDDSVRRLTDDFGRHRLTDLLEADESEEDALDLRSTSRRKRYSSIGSTASSMDGLWELHPRRLSEAGLSRHADSSAILTEDTDSFIIGQRVWVGGTKPGTIAYIGETQFAPGEWAGIALDEPIGKNDGSVAGIRYFQCENKKGVFSRLTRLTRVPLEQPGMGSNETFTSPNNGLRRSPISPTGSTRSLLKSPVSLTNSNTSLTSAHVDYKIGDRVIIKSTQGSKVGTVRYMGLTDFAPGEWVGVELDDPRGKNDGSVEGKRYFECRPNFGLFAPIAKVSKSPSKYKPGACVVHSGTGLPPSGMKKTNSKESLNSLASRSSIASSNVRRVRLGVTSLTPKKAPPKASSTPLPTRTALQDVLREKQQHIEQLLKERDLERAEITRAASQADDAEHRFIILKSEFEQYRSQCEAKARENAELLSQMKVDRTELLNQLEDERRRNEDLQFRFEEAAIGKSDIEENVLVQSMANESNIGRIRQLEALLADERQKLEQFESVSNKLFETEEGLIKAREELDGLRNELELTRQKRELLEQERTVSAELIDSLHKQLEGAGIENEAKSKTIDQLKEEVSKITSEHEIVKREAFNHKATLEEHCRSKDDEIHALKIKLAETEHMNVELMKENEKLKMDLSAKSHDLETIQEAVAHKNERIKFVEDRLGSVESELNDKINDLTRYKRQLKEVEENLKKDLDETRVVLKTKIAEVEDVKREAQIEVSQKDTQLKEATSTLAQNAEEIKKLHDELDDVKKNFEASTHEIHTRHARQVADQDSQLMALSAEIQQKNEEITKSSIVISKLEEDLCTKNSIIEKLRLQLEACEVHHSNYSTLTEELNGKIHYLQMNYAEIQGQLKIAEERIAALLQAKQNLEAQIQNMAMNYKGESAAQLEQLHRQIQEKDRLLEMTKAEYAEKLQALEKARYQIELQSQQHFDNYNKLKAELEKKLEVSYQSEQLLRKRCDNTVEELSKIRDEYKLKITDLEQSLQQKDILLNNLQGKCTETERYYQDQLNALSADLNRNMQAYQDKLARLNEESLRAKEELNRKSEEAIELDAKCNHILAQMQQKENEIKQSYGDTIRKLEFDLNEKNGELMKAQNEIALLKNDCKNVSSDSTTKDHRISELMVELQKSQNLAAQLQDQLSAIQLQYQQKMQEHEDAQNQCKGLLEEVANLRKNAQGQQSVFNNLQIEYNNSRQLMDRLRLTERQKQQCLEQLEKEAKSNGDMENCSQLKNMLNQMKVDNGDQNADKILQLQNQLQIIQNQLGDRNNEFESQKNEILRLQQELLKAREASQACMGGQLDQNSVRFNNTPNTQHNTLMHESSTLNPLELQVQLAIVKNSLRQISSKFQLLQRENNYLLARLQNALKNGNLDAVNDALRRFDQFKRQSVILHNIVQKENFNLQKRIQDCMLHLQQKNKLLNECRLNVNNLQNVVHNLPIQCRAFINGGGRAEDVVNKCANSDIDFKKLNDLLANKEQRIQQLQNQLGNLLVECNNQRAQSLVATQKPSAFMPSDIDYKKLNDLLANKEQRIQQLQNQLGNLLVQCNNQGGQSFVGTQKPSAFMPSNIDFKKLNDLLANKEQRIQQLQNQLGNLLLECNNNQRGQSFVGAQKPSAFMPSKTQIQKVTEVKQAPPKIIRVPIPVPQKPQVIVKTVYVPQINGRRCPPPKIERVEVPKYITRQVPFQVKVSQCILPDFSQLYNCESPKDITDKIDLKGYKPSEVFKFKQTLLSLLTRQRNCAITSSQNFNCPKLPSLVVPQNCGSSPQQIVKNLYINGYASSDANSFRQSLFQLLNKVQQCQIQVNKGIPWNANQQWPFLLKQQQNQLTCQRLPDLPTPVGCNNPSKIVNNLVLNGYSSSVVNNYKQSLLKLLNSVRYCALSSKWASGPSSGSPWLQGKVNAEAGCGYLKLPSLVVPDNCMSPMEIVQHVTVNGFGDTEVREYKNSLLNLLHSLEGCYCSKEQRKRAGHACVLPRFPKLNRHLSPNEIINVLNAWQCSDWRSDIFRHELFDFVISQQRYCRPTMFRVPQSVKIPVYVKVPVQVPRVVKVPVIIPKIIVKTREVPVKVPVIVKVPQQPKVLIKQIPVYIPQKPKVIIKEVPVDKQGNNNVVIKQVAVPVQLPPKIITKEVAVKVPVMIKVPYQVRVPVKVPVYQRIKVEVPVKVPVQVKTPVIKQVPVYVKVPVPQPPKIIIQKVPYQVIVEKRVPVYLRSPVVTKPNVQTVKVPIFQTKTLIKKVLVPGPTKTIVKQIPVMVNSQAKPKVIIKQVPVQLPPRIIIKQVSVKVPIRVPVPVQIRVPVQVPVKVPVEKIITKIVQVPVRVVVPCGTKDEVPGYGTPGYGIPGYGTPGSGTPGYGITGVPGSGTPGYGTPGFGSPGYGIPGVPGSGTPGYGVPGYGVPGYGTPGYGTPGYGVPGYGTPGYGTPGSGTPAYGIPGVPGSGTPGYGVPGYGVPGYGTPESGTPGYGIPGVPGSGTPGYGIPGHGTPGYGIPGTPGYGIPGYGTPGPGTPESGTPSYGIPGLPGSETPGYGTPGYGIPGTPGSGTPGYGTHGYGTPGYGTPGYGIPGTPGYGIPGYGVPGSGTPGYGIPGYGIPGYGIPGYGVPGSGTPGYGIPGYGTPGYGIPGVPGSGTPGYGIPGSETPGFGVPGYGTPGYGIPGMPGSGTPGFGKPGYGTSESGTPGYGIVKEISIPQPPKIIVKQIPVMVKSEPKILIKQVPILVTSKCKPLIKQVPVTVQSAPKIIIKQVAVKIPVPVRVVVPCGTKNEVPGYGTPGHGTPGYGTPGYGTPGYGTPGYGIPGSGTPGYGTPGSGKSEYDTPEYGTPGYGIPGFGTPGSGTPGSGIPGYGTPGYGTPGNGTPGSGTPGYGIPGYGTPGYGTPGYGTPASGTTGYGIPGYGTPGYGTPGSGTPESGTTGYGVPGYGTPGSGVQKCKPVIQQVFVPVKQTVKVPKIVIKTVSVPVKIAVPVPVQQPAKILVKQVPVYITQKPKIIIKQVPVYLTKKDKVKIIVKEKIVPVQLPPRTLIKEIPVQIKVPIRVPVPVRMVVKVPVPVKQIVEVPKVVVKKVFVPAIQTESSMKQLPVQSPRVIVKEVPVKVYVKVPIKVPVEVPQYSAKDTQLPLKVVTKQVPVYIPQKPRIIVQQVPIYTKCKNKVNVVVRERPVPVQLPPKTMIKEVPVKVYVKVPVEVPKYIVKNIQIPPRILTKQVPVYVPQPARTIIKQVPIYINGQNKVIVKEKQVRVPSPPRVIVKEVPVRIPIQVKVPVQQIVKVPQVVVKEVRVPVAQPPKIIVKQVPVYIPQSPTSGVPQKTLTNLETQDKPFKNYDVPVKYIQVPPKVITKQVPIYIPQRPRVIIKQVPVGVNCQGKVNVIVKEKPVPILSPPRIVTKEVRVPVKQIVQVPKVVIKEVQVPKMVIQKVFVPGKTKTRVVIREKQVPIVKEVPTKVYVKVPVEIPKYIVKYVQLPPRYITRQVPVYIPQRPRIIVKQVPIYISGKDKIKVIMKERPVAVPSSPRIITKVVRVPIKEVVEVPKIVLQQVRIPVQQPPKIITQKVFVPGETQTRVVEKQVPVKVYVKVPVDRVVYKQAPGCIPQRPQIVIKQVPVYISGGNKPGMNMNDNLMQIPSSHINTGEGRVPSKQLFGLPDGGDGQVQQSPRVIIQKVFVPGKTKTQVVIREKQVPVVKEVPVKVYVKVPVEVPKYIVKHIQLPPKVITKQIPVYIPQRAQIVVKQVPIYITGKDKVKVIVKEKPVPVLSPPRVITKEVKVPVKEIVEIPKIVLKEVRIPVQQPPKIITQKVFVPGETQTKVVVKQVPVKVYVKVPVDRVVYKQAPGWIPQRPQIVIKQVPVYISGGNKPGMNVNDNLMQVPSSNTGEGRVPSKQLFGLPDGGDGQVQQSPRVIIQKVFVPGKPRTEVVIKQVPVLKEVPVKVYVKVPVEVPKYIVKHIQLPPRVITKQVPVYIPQRPQIVVKQVPIYITGKDKVKVIVKEKPVPVLSSPRIITKEVKVPVKQIVEVPKIVVKEVRVPLVQPPQIITRNVPVYINQPPKVIIQRVPVSGKVKTKVIVKQVPVVNYVKVPVEVPRYIVKNIHLPPKIITKQVAVYVPQPAKVVVKQVPIYVKGQHKVKVIVKERPVPVPSPPRVIVKEVPVRVPIEVKVPVQQIVKVPQVIVKEVRVPVVQPARIITKQVPVYISQPPRIITQKVLVPGRTQVKVVVREKPVIKQVPVKVYVKVPVKTLVEVPKHPGQNIQIPAKVITKQVPVYIPQRPQIIIKQVPVYAKCENKPNVIIKEKPVMVPSAPRIIIKEVQVPMRGNVESPEMFGKQKQYPGQSSGRIIIKEVKVPVAIPKYIVKNVHVPPKIITKQVPVYVPQRPQIVIKQVPVYMSCNNKPNVIVKERIVSVPSPPRIITKEVPVRVPVEVRVPVKQVVKIPHIVVKETRIPVTQPAQIITKQVPVYIRQPPQIITKVVVKEKRVPIQVPARTIVKEVPVRVYVKVPVGVPVDGTKYHGNGVPGLENGQVPFKQNIGVPNSNANEVDLLQPYSGNNIPGFENGRVPFKQNIGVPNSNVNEDGLLQPYGGSDIPGLGYAKVPFNQNINVPNTNVNDGRVLQQPQIIVKQVPIYIPQKPKIIIKQVPVMAFGNKPKIIIKEKPVLVQMPPRTIIKQVPVNVPVRVPVQIPVEKLVYVRVPVKVEVPRIVEKIVRVPVGGQVPNTGAGQQRVPVVIRQPAQIIYKTVNVCNKPRYIIKQVPVEKKVPIVIKQIVSTPCKESPPRIIHVPLPCPQQGNDYGITSPNSDNLKTAVPQVPLYVNVPRKPQVIIKTVMVPQACRPVIKQVPVKVPAQIITKPVYIKTSVPVRVPQIVEKVVKVIQQVPIPQPPKIIEKQVPVTVQLPPKLLIKKVFVPIFNGTRCPVPKVVVEKVLVSQPPKIITKPVLVPIKVPPKVLIKQVAVPCVAPIVPTTPSCNYLPSLPVPSGCIHPANYVKQLSLQGYPVRNVLIFKDNLLQIFNKQFSCGSPYKDLIKKQRLQIGQLKNYLIGKEAKQPNCNVYRQYLMQQVSKTAKYYKSQICKYRKVMYRLKARLNRILRANNNPSVNNLRSVFGNNQLPAVPIPMMHVMKSLTPSIPLRAFQQVAPTTTATSIAFVKNLHAVYKNTQEALAHCMDAILAQTLTYKQINSKCSNCTQLIQDKELAENQIRFLNSIIVDIQKKNEEQKARIQILEKGYSPGMADELKMIGLPEQRQQPPRVYCDICEEFDLHETEDCPRQNSDLDPPPNQGERQLPQQRPYCEICEEFGHATEDCKEDQTF